VHDVVTVGPKRRLKNGISIKKLDKQQLGSYILTCLAVYNLSGVAISNAEIEFIKEKRRRIEIYAQILDASGVVGACLL
jgi:hypothetical protein